VEDLAEVDLDGRAAAEPFGLLGVELVVRG
jgi:hypothetical protein